MMRRGMRRLIGRVLVVLVVVLAVGLAGLGFLLWRSVPDYKADLAVAGVSAPVEILRSADAVPQIFGATDADVMFGLGYAHAQDRLWQMELLRRTAQGRLAALVGPLAVRSDELLLRMGLYSAAKTSVSVQEPAALSALEAYAAGVNARIAEADGWGEAAPEFLLFPEKIAPWTPIDSLAVLKLLALQLASHVDREVLRARIAKVISPERLADIQPDDPNPGIAAMPRPGSAALDPAFLGSGDLRDGWASAAWAVSPARSATGASLLANDPHLNFSAPSAWYLVHLGLATGDVRGGTIPGIPVVLSGQNSNLAWGLTAANMDDQDVHIERLNPDNPAEVLGPAGWVPMRTQDATIAVRGADPMSITLQWTENGPVIPGSYYNLEKITPPGHLASISRTLFEPADTSFSAAFQLMFASSVADARIAAERFIAPAQNLTLADRDTIGMQIIGAFPRRHPDHATQGRTPSEGWVANNRWDGTFPYADNPYFYNPPEGALGSTNNKSVQRPFPRHVSFDWGDTQRILRLADRFRAADVHDRDSLISMQLDPVSRPALILLPMLLAQTPKPAGSTALALDLLKTWDGAMLAERPEPLIYTEWMRQFQIALIRDELGPDLISQFPRANAVFLGRVLSDTNGASVWCDDVTSDVPETCADMLALSLAAAMDRLATTQGDDPAVWTWGVAHVATHDHAVLGTMPVIGGLLNIRQPASGGDDTLLRGMTRGTGEEPLQNQHGAVYRALYDLADPDASLFLVSTGQSGHFLSPHYRDMAALWLSGNHVRLPLDHDALRAYAIGVTWLRPE